MSNVQSIPSNLICSYTRIYKMITVFAPACDIPSFSEILNTMDAVA